MTILGIETATATCSVALWRDGQLVGESRVKSKNRHAEIVADMLTGLMAQTGLTPADLNGVAVSRGPGSFTGLRIGMAMAKAIAMSQQIPIVGVPTPDALASSIAPVADRLVVVLPSRKGEVYAAPYRFLDGTYHREGQIEALTIDEFVHWSEKIRHVAGPGVAALMEAGVTNKILLPEIYWEMGAGPVARLGARRILSGEHDDLSSLEPEYIKPFFTTAKPRQWAESL